MISATAAIAAAKLVPWRFVGKVAAIGLVLAFLAYPWVALNVAKGNVEAAERERDATISAAAVYARNYDVCKGVNLDWEGQGESWTAATQRMADEATAYTTRLAAERAARLAAAERAVEAEAALASQITSEDCDEAVDQLVTALGWGR